MMVASETIITVRLFGVVFNNIQQVLLRKEESGGYGLPGGAMEFSHFTAKEGPKGVPEQHYAIFSCLSQRLKEKTGLELHSLPKPPVLLPAGVSHEPDERGVVAQMNYAVPIFMTGGHFVRTPEFLEKLSKGELMFIHGRKIAEIKIISPMMEILIRQTLDFCNVFQ
jgi:hypothetical protein